MSQMGSTTSQRWKGRRVAGRYEIVRKLGAGTQGTVFEVEDAVRGGRLALKLMTDEALDETTIEALRREFDMLSTLDHPSILHAHDFGVTSSHPDGSDRMHGWFYTAELIDGPDLITATVGVDTGRIVGYALDIAEALAHVHQRGILHRDLKPANLLIDQHDNVRIMDFGLATTGDRSSAANAAGTPHYMAPELMRGGRADERSDLYSLGAVLYHALVGRPPFEGEDAERVMRGHLHDTPTAPEQLRVDCSPALSQLVMQLLDKTQDERPASAAVLVEALEQIVADAPPAGTSPASRMAVPHRASGADPAAALFDPRTHDFLTWLGGLAAFDEAQQLWHAVIDHLLRFYDADRVTVLLEDDETLLLTVHAYGGAERTTEQYATLVRELGARLRQLRQPVYATRGSNAARAWKRVLDREAQAAVVLPIRCPTTEGVRTGAVIADWLDPTGVPLQLPQTVMDLAARSIQRALTETLRRQTDARRLQQLTRLYELASVPTLSLDPDVVVRQSLDAMVDLTGAERGFIFLAGDDGELQCRIAQERSGEPIAEPRTEVSWSIVTETYSERRAIKVDDALGDRHRSSRASVHDLQLRSVMSVPIQFDETILGVAYVDNRSLTGRFADDDLQVFDMFGPQVGRALERASLHRLLEERVADRTRELHEQTELALQSSRQKSEFLANMSHEIRTPMNAILGFAELLKLQGDMDAEQSDFVAIIRSSAESLLAVVNDVLDLSKIESGHMAIERVEYSPEAVANEVAEIMRPRAEGAGIELVFETSAQLPRRARGDVVRIRQVLLNLLGNAVKFTQKGRVTLRVEPATLSNGASGLGLIVSDTGVGIPPERHAAIFDAFAQADGATSRKYGGTGLGLTITKRIIDLAGGEIRLRSSVGTGSTFVVILPWIFGSESRTRELTVPPIVPHTGLSHLPSPRQREARILVVDDSDFNLRLTDRFLRKLGYKHLAEAKNGKECLRWLETHDCDLVLLDMQMPILSGFQTVRIIRRAPCWENLPVIAVTAQAMVGDAQACIDAGCDGYLGKPFGIEELERTLNEHLGLDQRRAS